MADQLNGNVALVTGAGSGIGRAVAERLAAEGAAVIIVDVDDALGTQTAAAILATGGQAVYVRADVTSAADVSAMVAAASARFGGLDILVNNAGGVSPPYFPTADPAQWERVLDLNLCAVLRCSQVAIRAMQERGGGAIVNIASTGGVGFRPYGRPEYGAAKAGVMRLTASLGTLKDELGVRVNCICPGLVDTPASRRERASLSVEERATWPPVALRPEQIADAVVMFVQDEELAGRVLIWPEGADWFLVPLDAPY